jgi:hypothetical protein
MNSRVDKGIVLVSACLSTAFLSLWLPATNEPLRVGFSLLVFWVLATPVFQWQRFWLLPVGALVASAAALVPIPSRLQLVVPLLIAIGLLVQFARRRSQSRA